jgi:hypothetical protein
MGGSLSRGFAVIISAVEELSEVPLSSDFLISASDLVKIPESGLARFLPDGVAVS